VVAVWAFLFFVFLCEEGILGLGFVDCFGLVIPACAVLIALAMTVRVVCDDDVLEDMGDDRLHV